MHDVWVITHPQEKEPIEEFLASHPNPHLHFVWVTLPRWLDTWNPADPKSRVGLHYVFWQKAALREAKRLHVEIDFAIAHHVSWGTVSEPPLLWRLPIPFVWGPVGGGQATPPAFRQYYGPAALGEHLRAARIRLLPYRPALRQAVRRSALILATNHESKQTLMRAGASRPLLFLDSGVREEFLAEQVPQKRVGAELTLLWAGWLQRRKCLPLLLEALARIKELPIRLLVAGRGPLRKEWEAMTARLGLRGRVQFLGLVPYSQMPALYRSADAFVFTSLRDSFGSQVLEAMAAGLPIVTLDHQGVGAFVPPEAGIKVAVTTPPEVVASLAFAIRRLAASEETRTKMGREAWEFAKTQTWPRRAELMSNWYEELVHDRAHAARAETRGIRQPATTF
ncbi:MAG: glycosyltransferase [Acidobacteriia bacterium]|nr:glycosyltransferase [Terriglobia bacterium]